MTATLDQLTLRVNSLLTRYKQVSDTVSSMEGTSLKTAGVVTEILGRVQVLTRGLIQRDAIVQSLKADNKSFQGQLRSLSMKVDELTRQVQDARSMNEDLSEEIQGLQVRAQDLEGQVRRILTTPVPVGVVKPNITIY